MQETQVQSLGQEDSLEKGMATHSRILAWRIPCTEPGGLTPWGHKELDTTERLTDTQSDLNIPKISAECPTLLNNFSSCGHGYSVFLQNINLCASRAMFLKSSPPEFLGFPPRLLTFIPQLFRPHVAGDNHIKHCLISVVRPILTSESLM